MKVRVQPPSPAALPPPDDGGAEREGEERSGTRPHTPETSSWEAERRGGKGAAPPPLLAPAKEGESPGLLCPPRHGLTAPSAPISAPIAPETGPCPAPHTRCPDRAPPQPGRQVREALGRELSRPSHFRGARRVSPPPPPPPPGRRRRRGGGGGGGGGGGVLLSRPLPSSPELAPNVRARWSEATPTKVVLPRCAAGAERGPGRSPSPGGTWRTRDRPPQVSARRLGCVCRSGPDDRRRGLRSSACPPACLPARPLGSSLLLGPGGRCVTIPR